MKKAKMIFYKLLYPRKPVLIIIPIISFAALILIFVSENSESAAAYGVYFMSAYSPAILIAAIPKLFRRLSSKFKSSKPIQKLYRSEFGGKYFNDLAFRGRIGIYFSAAVNFLYVVFRFVAGVRYTSMWFISTAIYYLALGCLRVYLIVCYRRRNPDRQIRCYRKTAWLLFLLNIPMGGMIILMVQTNSSFYYPEYIIYLSAFYTFYTMITSVINLAKFRKLGSPVLSAAKVLNFAAAMMSVLCLQTAMISRFSANGENFRKMMHTVTGSLVYGTVMLIAVCMLLHSKNMKKKAGSDEQI